MLLSNARHAANHHVVYTLEHIFNQKYLTLNTLQNFLWKQCICYEPILRQTYRLSQRNPRVLYEYHWFSRSPGLKDCETTMKKMEQRILFLVKSKPMFNIHIFMSEYGFKSWWQYQLARTGSCRFGSGSQVLKPVSTVTGAEPIPTLSHR